MSPQPFQTFALVKVEIFKKKKDTTLFVRHKSNMWKLFQKEDKRKAIYLASLLLLCSIKMPGSISRLCAKIISFAGGDDDDDDDDYDVFGEDEDDDGAQK